MRSILQEEEVCWFCGQNCGLHSHHVFGGRNRKLSEKYGLKIFLCPFHHNFGKNYCIHENIEMDLMAKRFAQKHFESLYGHEKFMEVFGKNYLED